MSVLEQFSLQGKVALITGSARGIGRALAEGFATAGAKVWLTDVLEDAGQQTARELKLPFFPADLAEFDSIGRLIAHLSQQETKLDILVNNAGIDYVTSLERVRLEDVDHVWKVNALAPVALTQGLLPLMRAAGRASIINITSIHEFVPHPQYFPYNMAKAALAMFTKSMAQELSPEGIRINNLAPGAVETNINRDILAEMGHDNFGKWIPIGRVAQTNDMVGPAVFLASEASSYVTGATLIADGGYLQNLVRYRLR